MGEGTHQGHPLDLEELAHVVLLVRKVDGKQVLELLGTFVSFRPRDERREFFILAPLRTAVGFVHVSARDFTEDMASRVAPQVEDKLAEVVVACTGKLQRMG